ncbi:MBL fold metallo-hydrolase [Oceanobacillus halophilus]|uniref:MBL fold metallo-hydrolase n=1 Tax=Oceanobacillus halophilus TaxID=930130 RepID=UPI001F4D8E2E|nr:MBL fold metallo-hydrolase [Oceanobacillus halophilus]
MKLQVTRSDGRSRPVYMFLVDGMLIDTGSRSLEKEILYFYKKQLKKIKFVVLTHSHEDHSGTASWIQENLNLPIYVHPRGMQVCQKRSPYPKYREVTWGARKEFNPLPLENKLKSLNAEWEVIYTPGHADDHVALYHEQTGRLFTGDLFVSPKTKVIMQTESTPVTMDSIRKLLKYDFKSMYCSHAGYFKDGKSKLKQKLEYLEQLYSEVERMHKEGHSNVEINKKLFQKVYPIVDFSNGEWDSLHIVSSIISEVDKKSFR